MEWHCDWLQTIADIPESEWNGLLSADTSPCHEWGWLHSMEASGSISRTNGWQPVHLVVRDFDGKAVAAAVLYLKRNSTGEYVYDHYWAEIAARIGINYYPKLIGAIAATPSPNYRFLFAPGQDEITLTQYILNSIDGLAVSCGANSVHFLFVDPGLEAVLNHRQELGKWQHHRYLWENHNYENFEAFLGKFTKNQRRNIRRERQSVADQHLILDICRAGDLTISERQRHAQWMWEFYDATNEQFGPWAAKFLNRDFFHQVVMDCPESVLFARARSSEDGEPIAMTMMLYRDKQLYGRFWGAKDFYPDLHFELCYYTPIEWCISHGIRTFDPGAGSPHKVRRGFLAQETSSFHHFFDTRLQSIFFALLPEVNQLELGQIEELNQTSPLVGEGFQ